jgi:hypothetical protein
VADVHGTQIAMADGLLLGYARLRHVVLQVLTEGTSALTCCNNPTRRRLISRKGFSLFNKVWIADGAAFGNAGLATAPAV